jgi:AraC family transcriptional regulator of adaptative response / DNA-3-methyladenine glycosylase II
LSAVELELELSTAAPFAADHLASFLAARAVPGVEAWDGETYHRTLRLPHGHGVARLRISERQPVRARLELEDERDRDAAAARLRRLLDLDAVSAVIDTVLSADPTLAPLIGITPGLRLAGSVEPFETAIKAVVGQQISVAGARTVTGRIVAGVGETIRIAGGPVSHLFPSPAALAAIDPALLPMPASRRRTIIELARRVAEGRIDLRPDTDRDTTAAALLDVPGIGPWTVGYVRMRGLGDPDVFLPTDLGVKIGLQRLGIDPGHAERWRPWRSYALHHVWIAAGLPQ